MAWTLRASPESDLDTVTAEELSGGGWTTTDVSQKRITGEGISFQNASC